MQSNTSRISFFIIIGVTLAVALIIGLVVYTRYRRRLDAAVKGDSDPSLRNHRGISLGDILPSLLIIILLIWNGINMGKISTLSAQVDNLNLNMMSRMSRLENRIDSLKTQEVKADSLLENWEVVWGTYDPQYADKSVSLQIRLVPKNVEEGTQVLFQMDGQEYVCQPAGAGIYTVNLRLPLFSTFSPVATVTLKDAKGTRTEWLGELWPEGWLWKAYLPYGDTNADLLAVSYNKGTLEIDGELYLQADKVRSNVKATQVRLVKELNGQVVESQVLEWKLGTEYSWEVKVLDRYDQLGVQDRLEYYVETETSLGLTVRCLVAHWSGGASFMVTESGYATVLDRDGKELFRYDSGAVK